MPIIYIYIYIYIYTYIYIYIFASMDPETPDFIPSLCQLYKAAPVFKTCTGYLLYLPYWLYGIIYVDLLLFICIICFSYGFIEWERGAETTIKPSLPDFTAAQWVSIIKSDPSFAFQPPDCQQELCTSMFVLLCNTTTILDSPGLFHRPALCQVCATLLPQHRSWTSFLNRP